MKNLIEKPNSKRTTLTASFTNFAMSHPRLLSIGIYAGIVITISAAIGFVLYPEQQASAKAFVFYPE